MSSEDEAPFERGPAVAGAGPAVWLRIDRRLPRPLGRAELTRDPVLGQMKVLAVARGTNFAMTREQGRALLDRIDRPSEAAVARSSSESSISLRTLDILHMLTRIPIPRGQVALFKMLLERGEQGLVPADLQQKLYSEHPNQASGLFAALARRVNTTQLATATAPGLELMLSDDRGRKRARPELLEAIGMLPTLRAELARPWSEVVDEITSVACDMPPGLTPSRSASVASVESPFARLRRVVGEQGLIYSDETLSAFLLALQTKRFVILSGISGTGKTRLALAIARWAGGDEVPLGSEPPIRRIEVIPVRPDWTDSRGLLGFYNPILKTYDRTAFLDLVLQAGAEELRAEREGREPIPFFAVLDEMNLAHVEQYFADFLSAMESGEGVPLHDQEHVARGAAGGEPVPKRLVVPRNLFFCGTVNVDETTHMFSPKVLDRAFVLELNEVWLDGDPPDGELRLARLPESLSMLGRVGRADWDNIERTSGLDARSTLIALHRTLAAEGRPLGYRPIFEIARYLRLAFEQGDDRGRRAALDLAVLQKVLPKLHGTQQELEPVLRRLFDVAVDGRLSLGEYKHDPVAWYVTADGRLAPTGDADDRAEPELPRCAAKLHRMLRDVRRQGFTSFIG